MPSGQLWKFAIEWAWHAARGTQRLQDALTGWSFIPGNRTAERLELNKVFHELFSSGADF